MPPLERRATSAATSRSSTPGRSGGLCILRGCMPSKALLGVERRAADARDARALGIHVASASPSTCRSSRRASAQLVQDFADYRIEGIEQFPLYLRRGSISLADAHRGRRVTTAGGAEVRRRDRKRRAPDVLPGLAETGYLDSDAVLELETIPESVVVLGGGYTACELGQFLARMGARTTMLIRSGHLLTQSDDDVGDALTRVLSRRRHRGRDARDAARARSAAAERRSCATRRRRASAKSSGDEIFYALGRVPNVEGLDLEKAGIAYGAAGGIAVDATLRTSNPNVYAVGDVTGEYMLVHVAIYQGEVAARNACLNAR